MYLLLTYALITYLHTYYLLMYLLLTYVLTTYLRAHYLLMYLLLTYVLAEQPPEPAVKL